jgi:acyl carrier protein
MLTEDQIKISALELIRKIAPEADIENLDPTIRFRDQFDFDSIDFMNFAIALQSRLDVEIPEEDYPHLATLKGCIAYLNLKCNLSSAASCS